MLWFWVQRDFVFLCRTTVRTCPFVSHAVSLDVQQAVQQSTAEKPTHQQPTIPPCVYNNSTCSSITAEKKAKTQRRGDSIGALSRIERSAVEPTENVLITCLLRESNLEKSSLTEFGCGAPSFAGDREGCFVRGTWRCRAVSGDRVAPESSRC